MSEYALAKTKYLTMYPKWYSPIFKPHIKYDKNVRLKFNSRWERVELLLPEKEHFCLLIKWYQATLKSHPTRSKDYIVRKHFTHGQQTPHCSKTFYPRAANTTLFVNSLPAGSKHYIVRKHFTHGQQTPHCSKTFYPRAANTTLFVNSLPTRCKSIAEG